nr:3994_t:CDS:2 [Entrophospora candida]
MSSERELLINRLRNPNRSLETIKKMAKQIAQDKRAVDPIRINAFQVLKRYFIIEPKVKELPIEDKQLLAKLYREQRIISIYAEIANKIRELLELDESNTENKSPASDILPIPELAGGIDNLYSTIIRLVQTFVKPTMPLLVPSTGTKPYTRNPVTEGGKNAASAHYLSITQFTRVIFHPDDDKLFEPKWHIPMVLVNGYNTNIQIINLKSKINSIMAFPTDIIHNLRRIINSNELVPMHPWYRSFQGKIKQIEGNKYFSYGVLTKIGEAHIMISEFPVRKWTENYESELADLIANGFIKGIVKNNCIMKEIDLEIINRKIFQVAK